MALLPTGKAVQKSAVKGSICIFSRFPAPLSTGTPYMILSMILSAAH